MSVRNLFAAAAIIALLMLPYLSDSEPVVQFVTMILIYAIFALAFDFVFGGLGLLSLGHAAFFGIGAYAVGVLTLDHALNYWIALLVGCLAGAACAALFTSIALRLEGIFFSLVTLAMSELIYNLALTRGRALTGGYDGLPGVGRPELASLDFGDGGQFLQLVVVLFVLTLLFFHTVRLSPFGRVMAAIRLNPTRADQAGLDLRSVKITAFALSGFFSALAGGLLASLLYFVDPEVLHWGTSGKIVIMTVLGGSGTLAGPVIGVLAYEGLREVLGVYTDHWHGILGLIFILFTIFAPAGIAGLAASLLRAMRGKR